MKRTISGMIGTGSLAHNRRDFIAENVDPDRVQLNICYRNENLKEVYKELFDEAVERYNVGKRKDRQITNYYEKIRQGKQEKLFHEVIFQIGNREDMAVGTEAGDLAVNVLDEYVKDFQKRNPTIRVFSCYLHQDEATPHLHIDFIPYVTGWKGKGMDTRVSLKQALKSLGFQGGNKHDTELNQWINHEKEVLAETAKQYGIEWEQKGTHEEHLDVYNFKKKERKKEVQELEQEKEHLTAEKEELTAQIAESRADIQNLKDDKEQAIKAKQEAEQKAGSAEKELKSLEDRREQLQPIMDSVSKEIKEYGTVKMLLPEAGTLERAVTYRDKKIKPLFLQIKNKVAVMAAQVKELTKEVEGWKRKYQKVKQKYNATVTDTDEYNLKMYLEEHYEITSERVIKAGIDIVSNENKYHPIRDYLESLVWDGIPRIENMLPHFLGAEKSKYTIGVMKMHMLAAISRIYEPGIKYDIMLCLVGSQGAGKSTFFKYLAIKEEWFSDNLDHLDDENIYRKLQNHWIIEMGEMKATITAKNIEQIKSFLSRQKETYKVPYEVHPEDRPRQCVFCGTSNDLNFLPLDRTGNRRFAPVMTDMSKAEVHILDNETESKAYIEQAWAEAMVLYRQGNVFLGFALLLTKVTKPPYPAKVS